TTSITSTASSPPSTTSQSTLTPTTSCTVERAIGLLYDMAPYNGVNYREINGRFMTDYFLANPVFTDRTQFAMVPFPDSDYLVGNGYGTPYFIWVRAIFPQFLYWQNAESPNSTDHNLAIGLQQFGSTSNPLPTLIILINDNFEVSQAVTDAKRLKEENGYTLVTVSIGRNFDMSSISSGSQFEFSMPDFSPATMLRLAQEIVDSLTVPCASGSTMASSLSTGNFVETTLGNVSTSENPSTTTIASTPSAPINSSTSTTFSGSTTTTTPQPTGYSPSKGSTAENTATVTPSTSAETTTTITVTTSPTTTTPIQRSIAIVWDVSFNGGNNRTEEAIFTFVNAFLLRNSWWTGLSYSVIPFPDTLKYQSQNYDTQFKSSVRDVASLMSRERGAPPTPNNVSDINSALVLLEYQPTVIRPTILLFSSSDSLVSDAQSTAATLRNTYGYDIFAVGVGSQLDFGSIPSSPSNVFTMDSHLDPNTYPLLVDQITDAMNRVDTTTTAATTPTPTTACPPGTPIQRSVAIVWDVSFNGNNNRTEEAIFTFINSFLLRSNPEWTNVVFSVIPFPDPLAYTQTNIDYAFKSTLRNVLTLMGAERSRPPPPNNISDINSGLTLLESRPSVPLPTVLLFASSDDLVNDAESSANSLKNDFGYEIFAVGVGAQLNFGTIPSNPSNVFTMDSHLDPSTYPDLAKTITKAMISCIDVTATTSVTTIMAETITTTPQPTGYSPSEGSTAENTATVTPSATAIFTFVNAFLLRNSWWTGLSYSVIPFPDTLKYQSQDLDYQFKSSARDVASLMSRERGAPPPPNNVSDINSALVLLEYQPTVIRPTILLFSSIGVGSQLDFGSIPSSPTNVFTMDSHLDPNTYPSLVDQITDAMNRVDTITTTVTTPTPTTACPPGTPIQRSVAIVWDVSFNGNNNRTEEAIFTFINSFLLRSNPEWANVVFSVIPFPDPLAYTQTNIDYAF
ncbi:unnamed protein product, partial [Mesorhabditis belari]